MMTGKKLLTLFLVILMGCASTRATTQVAHQQQPDPEPLVTNIDLSVYSPPPLPSTTHSLDIATHQYPPASGAAVATITEGTVYRVAFTGVCINGPAQATIESDVNADIRTTENEARTRVATLGAQAIRDIAISRSDANVLRAYFQAQLRNRDDQIANSNRMMQVYESNSGMSVWQGLGWGALGVFAGIAATGVYLLITH